MPISLEDLMIGGFWGARAQTAYDCASLAVNFTTRLRSLGPPFDELWYGRDSPADPRRRFVPDVEAVAGALARTVSRRDTDGALIPELGFGLSLDEGRNRLHQAGVHISCGLATDMLWNRITVTPSSDLQIGQKGVEWLRAVIRAMVVVANPDWARVDSDTLARERSDSQQRRPTVGWMIYLNVPGSDVPTLPSPARAIALESGTVIETVDEWFDPTNPLHRQQAGEVERRLLKAGVLERLSLGSARRP